MSAVGALSGRKAQCSRLPAPCRKGFLLSLRSHGGRGELWGRAPGLCAWHRVLVGFWKRGRRDGSELLHPRVLKANVVENGDRVFL